MSIADIKARHEADDKSLGSRANHNFYRWERSIHADRTELIRMVEQLQSQVVRIYNSGYHAGHHDTVEGGYVDIYSCDMDTYHADVVEDILADINNDQEMTR